MKKHQTTAQALADVRKWITDQLQNNDVAGDDEIIDFIADDTTVLSRSEIAAIVTRERPRFLVDMFHEIDWTQYRA